MPTFEVHVPVGANQIEMRRKIREAVAEATRRGKLRPNSVDSITGENSGNNLGPGTPIIHFDQWERDDIEVKLILKGGGCENTNAQYSLPTDLAHLGRADRSLEGVRKCILHAVWHAQGKGCGPGAVGVCIGGDRTSGYLAREGTAVPLARRRQHGRAARRRSKQTIMTTVNSLGVGPMGFGGGTTLIGCKIGAQNRLPASFFVSIAYDCWAFRRLGVLLERGHRRDHRVAVSRSGRRADSDGRRRRGTTASRRPAARSCCARRSTRPRSARSRSATSSSSRAAPTPDATPCTIT